MPGTVPFRLRIADELPSTADLVIVGAGVVGCATAFYAARAGLRTVVLDARPRPATLTTAAATGSFRLQFDNADELALVREGVELFDAIAERTGLPGYDIGLVHRGYLFCARTTRIGRAAAPDGGTSASDGAGRRRDPARRRGSPSVPLPRRVRPPGALPRRRRLDRSGSPRPGLRVRGFRLRRRRRADRVGIGDLRFRDPCDRAPHRRRPGGGRRDRRRRHRSLPGRPRDGSLPGPHGGPRRRRCRDPGDPQTEARYARACPRCRPTHR